MQHLEHFRLIIILTDQSLMDYDSPIIIILPSEIADIVLALLKLIMADISSSSAEASITF